MVRLAGGGDLGVLGVDDDPARASTGRSGSLIPDWTTDQQVVFPSPGIRLSAASVGTTLAEMSDQHRDPWAAPVAPGADAGTGEENPTDGSAPAPPTPVITADANGPSRRPWPIIVGVSAIALVLVAGALWLAVDAANQQSGAKTPEAAVEQMIDAMDNEDFIAMAELLDPAERRTFAMPMIEDVVPELSRIGVFSDDIDLSAFAGLELEFENMAYEIEPTEHPDLVHAVITGGTTTATVTPDELPLGDALLDEMVDTEPMTEVGTADGDDGVIAFVERDGRWYVSMWHTVAETVRLDTGDPLPSVADRPAPAGAESPEAAVEQMIAAVVDLDLEGVLTTLDPDEADGLYRYAPMLLDDGIDLLREVQDEADEAGVAWEIGELAFDVDRDGDDAAVRLSAGRIDVRWPDGEVSVELDSDSVSVVGEFFVESDLVSLSIEMTRLRYEVSAEVTGPEIDDTVNLVVEIDPDDESVTLTGDVSGDPIEGWLTLDPDGRCSRYSLRGPDIDEAGCLEELNEGDVDAAAALGQVFEWLGDPDSELEALPVMTHQVDGDWYVSPTLTTMNALVTWLRTVDDDGFEQLFDDLESFGDSAPSEFSTDDLFGDDDFADDVIVAPDLPSAPPVPIGALDLVQGETTSVDVAVGPAPSAVVVRAPAGTEVTVAVVGVGGTDPTLEVLAGGVVIAENDDFSSATGLSSGLVFTVPETGAAELLIGEFSDQRGSVVLSLAPAADGAVPQDPGDLIRAIG